MKNLILSHYILTAIKALFSFNFLGISLVDESSDLREDTKMQELTTGLQYAYTKPVVSIQFSYYLCHH